MVKSHTFACKCGYAHFTRLVVDMSRTTRNLASLVTGGAIADADTKAAQLEREARAAHEKFERIKGGSHSRTMNVLNAESEARAKARELRGK